MPGLDGTGPQGRGPMTGRSMGFCMLKESKDQLGQVSGFVGIQGIPIENTNVNLLEQKNTTQIPHLYASHHGNGFGKRFRHGLGRGCGRGRFRRW